MDHKWKKCNCSYINCLICKEGLLICEYCNLTGRQLTTDCAGKVLKQETILDLTENNYDFADDEWFTREILGDR